MRREASAAALVDDAAAAGAGDVRGGAAIKVPATIAQRDQFAIWGGPFHGDAREDHVTFGGDPAFVLAASPECLIVAASSRVIPGPAKILVSSPPQQWSADSVVIGLNFDPLRPALEPGKRSKLVLHAQGTTLPLRVLVENKTPGILQFVHGDAQQLTTAGGEQNAVSIEVMAISTGDFSFNARLLREPDVEMARRFFEAAALLAPPSAKGEVKKLAERLKKKPQEAYKVVGGCAEDGDADDRRGLPDAAGGGDGGAGLKATARINHRGHGERPQRHRGSGFCGVLDCELR